MVLSLVKPIPISGSFDRAMIQISVLANNSTVNLSSYSCFIISLPYLQKTLALLNATLANGFSNPGNSSATTNRTLSDLSKLFLVIRARCKSASIRPRLESCSRKQIRFRLAMMLILTVGSNRRYFWHLVGQLKY